MSNKPPYANIHKSPFLFSMVWLLTFGLVLLAACRSEEPQPTPIIVGEIAANTIKLEVTAAGLYQVTREALEDAGLALETFSADTLSLTYRETAVPYLLTDDSLIFYGQAPDNRYTASRVYLLQTGQSGQLMAETAVLSLPVMRPLTEINRPLHLEENHIYEPTVRIPYLNGDNTDVWYWAKLGQKQQLPLQFELPTISDGSGTITLNLIGLTQNADIDNDHDFDLILNDHNLGVVRWDGETSHTATLDLPVGTLQTGTNNLILDNKVEGAAFLDIMQLNWIELNYPAPTDIANDEQLTFTTRDEDNILNLYVNEQPIIVEISDPANPRQLTGWTYDNKIAQISPAPSSQIAFATPDGLFSPRLTPFRQSDWHDNSHQADLIIITTDELLPALDPLVQARQEQGLTVATILAGEIYDEFGYGHASPESIQAFVAHAYENWQAPQPRYLFLVGEATTDHRNYLSMMPRNHIPTLMVDVQYGGETVSDSRLADVDGDAKPDLAVGRWPVDTVTAVEELVTRTLAYETATAVATTLFATDGTEPQFASIAERLRDGSQLSPNTTTILNGPKSAEVTAQWNKGNWLTTYVGHGSIERWGKEDIFFPDAVANLNGGNPPIVLQLTCLTGLFAHPEIESLSETMLRHANGPVLLVAATSLTLSNHQEPFAQKLLQELQNPANTRIGDAFQIAKQSLEIENNVGLREISDTFALIGDPSTRIVRPTNNGE